MKKHRNSQKRIEVDEGVFAVTTVTKDRYPYFREKIFCEVFVEQLRLSKQIRGFRLYGFCLMPDHLHIVFQPKEGDTISKVMHFLKRNTSRNINRIIGYQPFTEGEDDHPRLRCEYNSYRNIVFSHEKSLNILKLQFQKKYPYHYPHPKFSWPACRQAGRPLSTIISSAVIAISKTNSDICGSIPRRTVSFPITLSTCTLPFASIKM